MVMMMMMCVDGLDEIDARAVECEQRRISFFFRAVGQ